MTTITNNKLPEWRTALDKCVENYQSTRAWYEENRDSPAALDDMERAEDQLANFVRKCGFSIVLGLLDEIDELQELRRNYLALRGEIEDVQSQLYEAENQANEYASELQERRKADSAEPIYQWREAFEEDSLWDDCTKSQYDGFAKKADCEVRILYTAPPASERERIRREHAEWSDDSFGDVGSVGPLKHLSKEAIEAAAEPDDLSEWADMQFLLWDAQRRAGISDGEITAAMVKKLAINKTRQWPEPKDGEPRLHIKEQPVPVMPPGLHPDTQKLVADFSTDLAEKLYKAQLKYGYDADWKQDNWSAQCLAHFHQHIAKGDPRDVAAYCAFMWYHDWKTEPATAPVVPEECPADISVLMASHSDALFNDDDAQEIWNACRAAMLQGGFRDLSQPVDPQVTEYEQIMLRAGWVMMPVEPTDEMIAAAMECDDVVFDSKDPTAFCVQYREIYYAMVDAAPKQEGNNG